MRRRAIAFGAAALACAALAAAAAASYSARADRRFGELHEVVVVAEPIERGVAIDPAMARSAMTVRRVPGDFVPPDALGSPSEAVGLRPAIALVPGSYVTAGALRPGPPRRPDRSPVDQPAGSPVEVTVSGAGALAASPAGTVRAVDVVVTAEPRPGGGVAATRIAARDVPLLDLRRGGAEPGIGTADSWIATLALDRGEALRLIRAESFARSIRLLAAAG